MKENPLFQLRDDDIFYEGSIEELQKFVEILQSNIFSLEEFSRKSTNQVSMLFLLKFILNLIVLG